ncbi:MAG: hypothetical protein K0R40_2076 [Burkholderiales bacterium]|nr:hypothetical protein [Burkholderiales bacterium]
MGPRGRTLRKALEILGTEARLARALEISSESLRGYLAEDDAAIPYQVFIKALDIVAKAPRNSGNS